MGGIGVGGQKWFAQVAMGLRLILTSSKLSLYLQTIPRLIQVQFWMRALYFNCLMAKLVGINTQSYADVMSQWLGSLGYWVFGYPQLLPLNILIFRYYKMSARGFGFGLKLNL